MESYPILVSRFKTLTIFAKLSILDVCRVRGYVFDTQLPRSKKGAILRCHRRKLGVLEIFMEGSVINPNKLLFRSKSIFWQQVKNSQSLLINDPYFRISRTLSL